MKKMSVMSGMSRKEIIDPNFNALEMNQIDDESSMFESSEDDAEIEEMWGQSLKAPTKSAVAERK